MRTLRVLLASLLLASTLAACGSDDSDEANSDAPPAPPAADKFPVTVATAFGDVEIEEQPKRVVALGWGDAETALALGVQPIGASDWLEFGGEGVGPWSEGLYDEAPEIISTLEPELEKIAALEPDLILDVNSSGEQKRYDALSQIATTVSIPEGGENYATGWRQQMETISTALGESAKGDKLIEQVDDTFAAKRKEYPQFDGKTIAIGSLTSEGWGAYVRPDTRVEFAENLGFANSPELEKRAEDSFSIPISDEQVDLLDADLTVAIPIYLEASDITGDELFNQVPSVADGRDVIFDDEDVRYSFSTGTVPALLYALEEVPPLFADTLGEK